MIFQKDQLETAYEFCIEQLLRVKVGSGFVYHGEARVVDPFGQLRLVSTIWHPTKEDFMSVTINISAFPMKQQNKSTAF